MMKIVSDKELKEYQRDTGDNNKWRMNADTVKNLF
jgi:hypothetical protein